MKTILLFLIISFSLLAQTNDSLGVSWTDPEDTDLDSILLSYSKYYAPVDTPIFARIDEAIETYQGVAPDSGLLRIFAQAKDDSGNVSVYSTPDTLTIWQTAGGATERVAGDSVLFIYSDLTDGTVTTGEWTDQISGRTFTVTGTPTKGATGITVDGSDGFYNDVPDYAIPSALFLEVVVYIPDTSAIGATAFLASVNDGTHSLTLIFRSDKLVLAYDASEVRTYNTTPFHNSVVHVIAAHNAINDSLWINGSPVVESASSSSGSAGDQDYLILGQYDAGGDGLPNLSRLYFLAVNPKFPTDAEAEQNYTWWTEQ